MINTNETTQTGAVQLNTGRMPFDEVMAKGELIIAAAGEMDDALFARFRLVGDSAAFLAKHYDLIAGQDALIDAFLSFAGWTSDELHEEYARRNAGAMKEAA